MAKIPKEKIFNGRATQLNYLDWGPSSAETLVMLHGGAWSWQESLSLIPTLAERRRICALDFRGNGKSGWVQEMYRLQDFAEARKRPRESEDGTPLLPAYDSPTA